MLVLFSHCSEVAGLLLFVFRNVEFTCFSVHFFRSFWGSFDQGWSAYASFPTFFHVIFGTASVGSCGSDSLQSELIFHVF